MSSMFTRSMLLKAAALRLGFSLARQDGQRIFIALTMLVQPNSRQWNTGFDCGLGLDHEGVGCGRGCVRGAGCGFGATGDGGGASVRRTWASSKRGALTPSKGSPM